MRVVEGHLEGGSQMRAASVLSSSKDWFYVYHEVIGASRMQLLGRHQLWIQTNRSWMIEGFRLRLAPSLQMLQGWKIELLYLQLFEY